MSQPEATQRRRWYQFSLRTLLIVVMAAAGLSFACVKITEPYRFQREAMAAITELGGTCETKEAVTWVRSFDNNAQDVIVVDLRKCDTLEDLFPHLARLPKVESLDFRGTRISDEQLAQLTMCRELRMLCADNTHITDAGLANIGAFHDLRFLSVSETKIGDACLSLISDLPMLRVLNVSGTHISDEGLSHLKRSESLRMLYLDETRITDEGVAHLETMTQLTTLSITLTQISLTATKRLKAALPKCYIARD